MHYLENVNITCNLVLLFAPCFNIVVGQFFPYSRGNGGGIPLVCQNLDISPLTIILSLPIKAPSTNSGVDSHQFLSHTSLVVMSIMSN